MIGHTVLAEDLRGIYTHWNQIKNFSIPLSLREDKENDMAMVIIIFQGNGAARTKAYEAQNEEAQVAATSKSSIIS